MPLHLTALVTGDRREDATFKKNSNSAFSSGIHVNKANPHQWTAVLTSHRSCKHPQRESNRDSARWELVTLTTQPHCHECPLVNRANVNCKEGQASCHIIFFADCHGSTPAGGVDKTDVRSKLQLTLDDNNF
ncbi:unnamed protein product [Protopolystoma xenopodis]|uniref:Uncharacterized protein n=1 Tax=Protopolystoma xenopodis TaxID=117903 RepID=A0A448XBS6_9PLAT|nr:unnamed protein product [Protopolystoma xenopodis]